MLSLSSNSDESVSSTGEEKDQVQEVEQLQLPVPPPSCTAVEGPGITGLQPQVTTVQITGTAVDVPKAVVDHNSPNAAHEMSSASAPLAEPQPQDVPQDPSI